MTAPHPLRLGDWLKTAAFGVVFLLMLINLGPARSADNPVLPANWSALCHTNVDFGEINVLCRALHTRATPGSLFSGTEDDRTLSIVTDLMSGDPGLLRPDKTALRVFEALREGTEPETAFWSFCDAFARSEQIDPGLAHLACMRPICLQAETRSRAGQACAGLPMPPEKQLWSKLAHFSANDGAKNFEFCRNVLKPGAVCLAEAPIRLLLQVERLERFLRDWPASGCHQFECWRTALIRLGRTYGVAGLLHQWIVLHPEKAGSPDLQNAVTAFEAQWNKVESHLPRRPTDQQKPLTDEQLEAAARFPFDPAFATDVAALSEPIRTVLSAQAIRVLQEPAARIAASVPSLAIPSKCAPCEQDPAAKKAWLDAKSAYDSLQQFAAGLRLHPDQPPTPEALTKAQSSLSIVLSYKVGAQTSLLECPSAGIQLPYLEAGRVDFCASGPDGPLGIAGLRLIFAPCGPPTRESCDTEGELHLLVRLSRSASAQVVSYPLGFSRVRVRIPRLGGAVELSSQGRRTDFIPDPRLQREALQRLLPAGVAVQNVGSLTLQPGLVLVADHIELEALGEVVSLCMRISAQGVVFGQPGSCSVGAKPMSLLDAFRSALTRRLNERKSGFDLPGVPVTVRMPALLAASESCPSKTLDAQATIRQRVDADVALAICAQVSFAGWSGNEQLYVLWSAGGGHSTWALAGDPTQLAGTIRSALLSLGISALPGSSQINVETVVLEGQWIRAHITVPGAEALDVSFGLKGFSSDTGKELQVWLAKRAAAQQFPFLRDKQFTFVGLTFTYDNGRACVSSAPGAAVPDILLVPSKVCFRDVTLSGGRPDFQHATLDDQGRVARYLTDLIGDKLPILRGSVAVTAVTPKLAVRVALPVVGDITVEGLDTGSAQSAVKDAVCQKAQEALIRKVDALKRSTPMQIGGVSLSLSQFSWNCSGNTLEATVGIQYGSLSVASTLELLPRVRLRPPDVGAIIAQLQHYLEATNKFSVGGGVQLTPSIVMDAKGIPIIHCAVAVALPGLPVDAQGAVELRPGEHSTLEWIPPFTITSNGWVAVASGIELGKISGTVDPRSPSNFSISANLAAAKGETTNSLLRAEGTLGFQDRTVTLQTALYLEGAQIMETTGLLDLDEQLVRLEGHATGIAANLPIPDTEIVLNGRQCVLWGKSSVSALKSLHLLSMGAVLVTPNPCDQRNTETLRAIVQHATGNSFCQDSAKNGGFCAFGNVTVGNVAAHGGVKSAFLALAPTAHLDASIKVARLTLDADIRWIRVEADVHHILSVTLYVPVSEGLDEEYLNRLLAALLRPSIDLDAITKGKIVIAPGARGGQVEGPPENGDQEAQSNEPGDDKSSATSDQSGPDGGQPNQQGAPQENNNPVASGAGTGVAGVFPSNPTGRALTVADSGQLLWRTASKNAEPYKIAGITGDRQLDAVLDQPIFIPPQLIAPLRQNSLKLVRDIPFVRLDDGTRWALFCTTNDKCKTWQFEAHQISGSPIAKDPDLSVPKDSVFPPDLAWNISVPDLFNPENSGEVAHLALILLRKPATKPQCLPLSEKLLCDGVLIDPRDGSSAQWIGPGRGVNTIDATSLWGQALKLLGPGDQKTVVSRTVGQQVSLLEPGAAGELVAMTSQPGSFLLLSIRNGALTMLCGGAAQSGTDVGSVWKAWEAPSSGPDPLLGAMAAGLLEQSAVQNSWRLYVKAHQRIVAEPVLPSAVPSCPLPPPPAQQKDPTTAPYLFVRADTAPGCEAKVQTLGKITAQLTRWARPPDFRDAGTGRLLSRTRVEDALTQLPAALIDPAKARIFLTDPAFLFPARGNCP